MARAFTLVELLVVIGVIIALVVTTLPAFRAIKESNREAGAMNALSATLNTARALAIRDGRDTAVLFKFDLEHQTYSMQMIRFKMTTDNAGGGLGSATIFEPLEGQEEIELPQGGAVYGYGYGASRGNPSTTTNWYADVGKMYDDGPSRGNRPSAGDPWLFPRTDPRYFTGPPPSQIENEHVQFLDTFVVRFGSDGTVVTNAEELGSSASGGDGYVELDPPTLTNDYLRWTPRMFNNKPVVEVQLRSVPFLAVVDMTRMAQETGIARPWEVGGPDARYHAGESWDTNDNDVPDQKELDGWINRNARLVSFNRFTGSMMREYRR